MVLYVFTSCATMDNHKKTKSPYLFIQLKFPSLSFNMCARKIHKESLVFVCDPGFLSNVCAGPAFAAIPIGVLRCNGKTSQFRFDIVRNKKSSRKDKDKISLQKQGQNHNKQRPTVSIQSKCRWARCPGERPVWQCWP